MECYITSKIMRDEMTFDTQLSRKARCGTVVECATSEGKPRWMDRHLRSYMHRFSLERNARKQT